MNLSGLKRRLLLLIHRDRALSELEEEISLHIEQRARRLEAEGAHDSHHAARRQFGNATQVKEASREMWGWNTLENLLQDFRYALRLVRKAPAFTLACVLTLGLGVGVNTAIFSTINAVLLRPLPYREAERLVVVFDVHPIVPKFWVPYPDYVDLRSQNTSFDDMAAFSPAGRNPATLVINGVPEQVQSALVSGNLLPMLGVGPAAGRNFSDQEVRPGHDQVAILGHSLWLRRFGGSPGVVGRSVQLDGKLFRITGVLPRGVQFPFTADVLLPVSRMSDFDRTSRKHHALEVIGRLKSGVTIARAGADLRNISLRLQQLYPATNNTISASLVPLNDELVGDVRTPLLILLAAVGLVLLIA
jgi:predicted permease